MTNIATLLSMAAQGFGDRIAVGSRDGGTSYRALWERASRLGTWLRDRPEEQVALVDVNSAALPVILFGAAMAGKPFVPLNYRLADDRLRGLVARTAPSVVVTDPNAMGRLDRPEGVEVVSRTELLGQLTAHPADADGSDADEFGAGVAGADAPIDADVAVLLFTSGTTGAPKAAVLRHENLFSYIAGSVDFMAATEDECALVSVPPYHIAGISAVLSSVFAGRRMYYLEQFDARQWVEVAVRESVTHAMVVPTMLVRILDVLEHTGERLPGLRHLSYGGGRMPVDAIERALGLLGHVDFANAYGLTETSSTIAVLTPEDHRDAHGSEDPAVRGRLASVGRPLPSVELGVRDPDGRPVPPGGSGEVWVRGPQVSGRYLDTDAGLDDGWFRTRDAGRVDHDGYLYIEGRLDDVIVRGGENISPGEVEDVILRHPAVREVAVCGLPHSEWGETVAAVLVCDEEARPAAGEVQEWVRKRLRSSKVPEVVEFRAALPYNETGKLLRREVRRDLAGDS